MNQQKSFMDNFLKKNIQQKKKEKLRQPSQRFQLTSIADEQKRRRSSSGHAGLRRHRRRPRLGQASPPAVWSSRCWPATLLARRYSSAPPLRACCRLPARRWSQEKNPAKRRERKRKGEKKRRRLDTGWRCEKMATWAWDPPRELVCALRTGQVQVGLTVRWLPSGRL